METKQCPTCGDNFNIKPSLSNQICCTIKCKKIYTQQLNTKQCIQCNKDYISNNKQSKFCSPKCRTDSLRTLTKVFRCKECSKEFKERSKARANNIFCSRECSFKNMNDNKLTDEEKRARDKNRKIKSFCNIYHNTCIQCSIVFISKTKHRQYCSQRCNRSHNLEIHTKVCIVCSRNFETKKPKENRCSKKCKNKTLSGNKTRKHRQRARKFNVKYEPSVSLNRIKKRDGKNCLICNKKVLDRNISGYHANNGTVGHIIALSNGGEHTMSNVQLECMECNIKKGASNGGQLRLF